MRLTPQRQIEVRDQELLKSALKVAPATRFAPGRTHGRKVNSAAGQPHFRRGFILVASFCTNVVSSLQSITLSNARKSAPMASNDASVAKIALDLHAELGPPNQKRRYTVSRNEKRRDEARLVFNKIIASHYRAKANDYSQVGALFITWAVNDLELNGKDSEVSCIRSARIKIR